MTPNGPRTPLRPRFPAITTPPPLPPQSSTTPQASRRRLHDGCKTYRSNPTSPLLGAAAWLLLLSSTLVGIALTVRNNGSRDHERQYDDRYDVGREILHQRWLRPTTPPPPWRRRSTEDGDCPRQMVPDRPRLRPGEFICSPSDRYRFGLGDDGRLGLWGPNRDSIAAASVGAGDCAGCFRSHDKIWSAETCCDDAYAVLQTDGNFVVYGEDDRGEAGVRPLWATNTDDPASSSSDGFVMTVSDDGTVVLSDARRDELWSLSAGHADGRREEPGAGSFVQGGCSCCDVESSVTRGGRLGHGKIGRRDHPPRIVCISSNDGTNDWGGDKSSSSPLVATEAVSGSATTDGSKWRIIAHRWDYIKPNRVIHRFQPLMYRPPRGNSVVGGKNTSSPSLLAASGADVDLTPGADRMSEFCREESWFKEMHPSCNVVHERDLLAGVDTALLGNGNSRQVWGVGGGMRRTQEVSTMGSDGGFELDFDVTNVGADEFVLKSLRVDRPFAPRYYEKHRIDAVALDRLTSSPRIVNIHGYCGQSSLNERANATLLSYVEERKKDDDDNTISSLSPLTPGERLRLARDVALALRDAHEAAAVGSDEDVDVDVANRSVSKHPSAPNAPVAILHEDVKAANVLLFSAGGGGDGEEGQNDRRGSPPAAVLPVVKLDDFNSAHFLPHRVVDPGGGAAHPAVATDSRYHGTSSCAVKRNEHCDHYRSPEQCRGDYVDERHDVFSLGGVIYFLVTNGLTPYSYPVEYEVEAVREMILNGTEPGYPPSILDSVDGAIVAMRNAVAMCRAHDQNDRPSSSEVADALARAWERYYT